MKTKLLFCLLFFSYFGYSQAPIQSFYGGNFPMFSIVDSTTPIDQNDSGANMIWNFDQLTIIGQSEGFQDTPTAAEIALYPNTTAILRTESTLNSVSSTATIYTSNNANTVSITGIKASDLDLNYSTNNAKLGTFPMIYGASNTDAVAGTYNYSTYSGNFTGTITTSVDAYGTISFNIPGIEGAGPSPVTRLKTVQNLSIFYGLLGNVGTVNQTIYAYYSPSWPGDALFRTTSTTINIPILSINQTQTSMEKLDTFWLSINNNPLLSNQIKITPNPVEDILHIQNTNDIVINSVTINDINGKLVSENTFSENIDVRQFPKGIYIATFKTEKGNSVQKFIKK